jgi:hypothetical protein
MTEYRCLTPGRGHGALRSAPMTLFGIDITAIAERATVEALRHRLHQGAPWYNESDAKPEPIVRRRC